jgi:Flp pilus assembly protein TadD
MSGAWWRIRQWLMIACLAAVPVAAWRGIEVVAEMRQDRLAAAAYERGVVFEFEGRFNEAAGEFRDAITISSRATAAYVALGDVEFKRGRTDDALWAYRQLMGTYPYTYVGELHRQVGLFELRAGRFEAAGQDLREAVGLDPQDWLAFHWLGHAYYRQGDFRSARAAWEHALSLNPDFPPARDQLRQLDAQNR